jgi:hypothetical protein
MTSADHNRNDLVPAQEKLEWVTPKISLMVSGDTEGTGKRVIQGAENWNGTCDPSNNPFCIGPS